jgi:acyl-CoA thioester hydrolase
MRHQIFRGENLCATLDMDGAWLNLKTRLIKHPPRELVIRLEALAHTENFRK